MVSSPHRVFNVHCILEYQAFSPSYDLAPLLSLAPLSRQQVVPLSQSPVRRWVGEWEGAKSYDGEKAWSSIIH